jgi:basic amino acid/polyamine antiporter, APA family
MAKQLQASGPGLLRQLGFISATALVVSNMIGTGIFTSTGFMAGDLGDARLILSLWAAGAFFALAGALSYSELGINFPASGGEYVYLTRAYGPTWGFMTGWVSFFAGFSAPIAAAALAFSDYLGYFWPSLQVANASYTFGAGALSLSVGGGQMLACALIGGFTALNCFGVARVAKVQNVLTLLKVLVIVGFIALAFLAGTGRWEHFGETAVRTATTSIPAQLVVSLVWVMVGYSGWNAATYVAEELRRPERTLPLALAVGTALVAALYFGLNIVFIYSTPLESMKGVLAIGSLSASNLFGPQVAGIFSALMAVAIMSTVNAMVTIGPRVYYAMAKNKAFFQGAAKVHPRFHTPIIAIVAQGACAMLLTLTPFPQLMIYIGLTLTFFTVMSVGSLFKFRRRPDWQRLRPVSFAFPLIPAAYIVVGTCMMGYGIVWQPGPSLMAALTIGVGAAVYHFFLRPRADQPPDAEIE